MRILLAASTLAAALMVLGSGASTVAVASPGAPDSPVAVAENFLLARNMGDFRGAAAWCASLLELQDSEGSWFVDAPTTSNWLRQLANRYVIDPLTHPTAESGAVVWTTSTGKRR